MSLKELASLLKKKHPSSHCLIGFDGFIDEIISVVKKRDKKGFSSYPTISSFADKLSGLGGKSGNFELFVKQIKVGGNAPILAQALLSGNHKITLIGTLGAQEVDPLFSDLVKNCEKIITLGPPGHTDALEFEDGKLILGKLTSLVNLSHEKVIETIGKKNLNDFFEKADLIVSANWTMLPMTNELWRYLLEEIAPHLSKRQQKRIFFVDLADPAKRSDEDIILALKLLQKLNQTFKVVLGLNLGELERISSLLKIEHKNHLREKILVDQIVLHSSKEATVFSKEGTFTVKTLFTSKPVINTGAGDNFNAGYCNGLLFGFDEVLALELAVGTAGFYVHKGYSPSLQELAFFLESWDK